MTSIPDADLFMYRERARGKVVVITGGSSGIGRDTALAFAKHGARLVIGDRDERGGADVVSLIKQDGGEALFVRCDVTNWDEQLSMFEHAWNTYGAVDVVIPNAGIAEASAACDGSIEMQGEKPTAPKLLTVRVNVIGVFYTVQLGMHYIYKNKQPGDLKALILIGSMASWQSMPFLTQYVASKHAMLGMMRSIYDTVGKDGIRVGVITPFFAETKILAPLSARVVLAGFPLARVPVIAGAIFRAATDPNEEKNGCVWAIPDHGPALLLEKEQLRAGVYKLLDRRIQQLEGYAFFYIVCLCFDACCSLQNC
ncbi:hypothetical protein K488DRAFT_60633 [Vararia minispora EC-137]|uniref:Uncharacterized protein n=1 Tax=Vararia minispora EC-137 TaxID=1314806 RepID=A0ACB8Q7U4_9AGAM|nr:hypothetical protein K488DRAFT_60633 [Vararia minispora EC-137]